MPTEYADTGLDVVLEPETMAPARGRSPGDHFLAGRRADWMIAALLFVGAAGLRAWGVRWSLPYVAHPDEPTIVNAGVHIIKTGDLNPHFFDYPSLWIYLQTLVYKLNLAWGTWRGYYTGPESLPDKNDVFALAPGLFVWGRMLSVVAGAVTVAALYFLGKSMFGRRAGLVAGLLLLTSPLHVGQSRYLVTDAAMTAVAVATVAASWSLAIRPNLGKVALVGALVGLTAAVKYNGAYIGIVALTAWAIAWRAERKGKGRRVTGRWMLAGIAMLPAAAATFLLTNPYVVFDWPHWLRAFRKLMNDTVPAGSVAGAAASFLAQLKVLVDSDPIPLAAGSIGAVLLVASAIWGRERRTRYTAWLLVPFPLCYMLLMSRFSLVYPRYLLVTVPFLCLVGGYLAVRASEEIATRMPAIAPAALRSRSLMAVVIGVMLVTEPGVQQIQIVRYLSLPDSRNLAYHWLQKELRSGHRVAVELSPWQFCAPPPFPCPLPDVSAPSNVLITHPPSWYAARGYDLVVLVDRDHNLFDTRATWGKRFADGAEQYRKLPRVRYFKGNREGGKGPYILALKVSDGLANMAGVDHSGARFGDVAELWGYAYAPLSGESDHFDPAVSRSAEPGAVYHPGQTIGLSLYIRALRDGSAHPGDWKVRVDLVDQSGALAQRLERPPMSHWRIRQVQQWYANEFLDGVYNLPLPVHLGPGTYSLIVDLVDTSGGRSLPVTLPEANQTRNGAGVQIAAIRVAP